MKTKTYLVILVLGLISWSCSTQDNLNSSSIKSSVQTNVDQLTNALAAIENTDGYQVLAISDNSSSSSKVSSSSNFVIDSTMSSILLSDISGIYDYKASTYQKGSQSLLRFFEKTAESDLMIVSLPEEKVKKPASIKVFSKQDTSLVNNYVFTLSKYEYNFNKYLGWNYQMASSINIKNIDAGDLKIQSSRSDSEGYKYASEFTFADNLKASCVYASGDTAVATYTITNGEITLYEETYTAIKGTSDKRHKEKEYTLTLGDIKIVRSSNYGKSTLDSAKVYLNNVLQTNASVEIIEIETIDATDNSIINKTRDLKITFEDGTSSSVSELLGTSVSTIRSLFSSLRKASFATSVIDRIAWDIYSEKN